MQNEDLSVQPMDEKAEKYLTERGKKFNKIGTGAHYLNYKGSKAAI